MECYPAESDEDSAPRIVSDTEHGAISNGDWDNPNKSKDDCDEVDKSDIQLGNGIKGSDSPEYQDVSAAPNAPGLIPPLSRSMTQAEKGLMTISAMETSRNKANKEM